jgi:hypothetical protein
MWFTGLERVWQLDHAPVLDDVPTAAWTVLVLRRVREEQHVEVVREEPHHATCDALPHGIKREHGSSAASARTSRDISALNAR